MGCKVFQRLFFNSSFWFDLAYRSCDLPTRDYFKCRIKAMGPVPQQLHSINYVDITSYQQFNKSVKCLSLLCFFLSYITDVLSSCVQ